MGWGKKKEKRTRKKCSGSHRTIRIRIRIAAESHDTMPLRLGDCKGGCEKKNKKGGCKRLFAFVHVC